MKMLTWTNLARFFEWLFGMIFMVALSVLAILPLLSGWNRLIVIIGLFLYFIASLTRVIGDSKTSTK